MSLNIGNCPRCGKVFAKGIRDVCPACVKEIDEEYRKCAEYLRENRGASIGEVSEETGVTIKQITSFIREGRISLADAPNLGYPCDVCGTPIREGMLCTPCRDRFSRDVKQVTEKEHRKAKEYGNLGNRSSFQIRESKYSDR